MRPVLFIVGLVALYAQSITSHPTLLPLPFLTNDVDDAGLLSADLGLDPPNQFFTPVVGTADDPQPGALFPALDTDTSSSPSSSDNAEEALLSSQQVALDDEVGSLSASSPPLLLDNSQESRDPAGCDTGLKGKRETTGGAAGTSTYCPALYPSTNLIPPSAPAPAASAQKKNPEGQQQDEEKEEEEEEQHQGQEPQTNANAKPREPGSRGDLRLNPSDEPAHNPFGEKNKEPQCPPHYRYTVCGSIKFEHSTGASPLTVYDADLVINFGFGYGTVIRPGWKDRGGIAGWTNVFEECGPDPRKIYCCTVYFEESRQAFNCETLGTARRSEQCWKGVMGLPSQAILNCIENL